MPAGNTDVFDEQAQQLLFPGVIEDVDDGVDAGREVVNSTAELIVTGEFGSFVGEVRSFVLHYFSAGRDVGVGGVDLAVQSGGLHLVLPVATRAAAGTARR